MSGDLAIELAGEQVLLLPERALFWPRNATVFIADAHWGKAATFRAASIPLPGGTTSGDLERLGALVERTGAQRLVLLGDLFHARTGRAPRTLEAVQSWRDQYDALEVLLVRGNHDRHAGDPPAGWRFTVVDAPYSLAPFVLRHYPDESPDGYTLAGHLHPGAQLVGAGGQRDRLPCFWFGQRVGVLPAFGSFTGLLAITPVAGDRVYVVAGPTVLAIGQRSTAQQR